MSYLDKTVMESITNTDIYVVEDKHSLYYIYALAELGDNFHSRNPAV